MIRLTIIAAVVGATGSLAIEEPDHASNEVYQWILQNGLKVGETQAMLPPPSLDGSTDPVRQRTSLEEVAGGPRPLQDLLRDSVTAPFVLKVRDLDAPDATIRIVDLWFVVRGELSEIDPQALTLEASGNAVEAGNMRFETRVLNSETDPGVTQPPNASQKWRVEIRSRLLDRIQAVSVSTVQSTRTPNAIVIASMTEPATDSDGEAVPFWATIDRTGNLGPRQPWVGGIGYTRITRLEEPENALLVEMHSAFAEPDGWFRGAPILRSKFAPIAQNQIRELRRTLADRRNRPDIMGPSR